MSSTSLSPLTICLLLSVCLLGSNASANSSLWGKKIFFNFTPCMWQLKPDTVVPALEELSVCVLLRLNLKTKWTGFVYKAPGKSHIELGLQGSSKHLEVWLFGKQHRLERNLAEKEWFSVCLTWSGRVQRLRVYINGTSQLESSVDPQQLAKNGTLTLGASHFVQPSGALRLESGTNLYGEIGLFRMWDREWSAEELSNQSCAGRDVLSWDSKQWKYNCKLIPDNKLQCAWPLYKIKMWTFITYTSRPGSCSVSLEKVTGFWLDSVFPRNVSVHDISVSSPSHDCHGVNNSAVLHVQQPQGLQANSSSCSQCFWCKVYVKVEPAANVGLVQQKLNAVLISTLSHDAFNLTVDPNSISILPVETLPAVTDPKPTLSTGETTSETGPTQSLPAPPANMSTTGEPLDLNETAMGPDIFFRVNLTLSMTGSPIKPLDVIQKWVKQQLEVNLAMTVVNLIVKEKSGRHTEQYSEIMIFQRKEKQYYCTFHVQDKKNTVNESQTLIEAALKSKYDNGSISIQTMDLVIANIQPTNCFEQEVLTIYGDYFWPETFPQEKQEMGCVKPVTKRAYRLCKLDIETDTTSWAPPDMRECEPIQSIPGLKNVTVTIGNAAEVVDMIRDLVDKDLGSDDELSPSDLDTVVGKLNEVVNISIIRPDVGADIVNIVSAILLSKTDITPVANTVLNMTERMGNNMDFLDESVNVTAPSLALSMINVDPNEFKGLTFGVASISSNLDPKVFLNQTFVGEPLTDTIAMISLPSALNDFFHPGQRNTTRVQFQFYGTQELFQDPLTTNATHSTWKLNPYIVSASINNSHVMNLKDPVVVTFNHPKPEHPEDKFQCMFWDFHKNSGQGGWDSRGCVTHSISPDCTSCLCDHLTHFAVLLDVSRAPISAADSQILTVISYLGCGISSIFLGITLLTYLAFEKLRRDYPSKILINLSAALLGLCMLFLVNSWLSSFSNYGLCIATAATLHYFLLASFTWMGLEAVHMYLALIKVFNTYIPSYILKFCAVGWGVPLLIVSLVLAIDKDAYGSAVPEEAAVALQSTEQFCWLLSDVFFYVTVVAFVLLILLCNISVFVVVLIQIRKMRANKRSTNSCVSLYDLRAVASLTVLLGLTWAMAFFSFGPARLALMYLFSILNSLQGFFVFLFHCLMKENVRKQWRIHLCCGRLRLKDCSDWSGTVSAGGPHRRNILVNSDSVASNSTSTIRKVSDSSTGSAPNHHQGA